MNSLRTLIKEIKSLENPAKAKVMQGFFKTKPGEYGEGDIFIGLTVPQSRILAKKYCLISFEDINILLKSKIHEERLIALLILVNNYQKASEPEREKIYSFYLSNTSKINNWDLVDLSADKIVGHYLNDKSKDILYELSKSENIWERRISIIATFHFIKNNSFENTIKIAEILLQDKHDLIQKAVGWMLREIGKRNQAVLITFLNKHYKTMPRTSLRYAIEKFPEDKRQAFLKGRA
ncbi:MAG: DNA alkylation repair protein [Nanoarchaeota archaeon]|nr:DNA alkylation repair protein [Nanoarchaeota archaeon]